MTDPRSEKLIERFPEISHITDAGIRAKTVSAFLEAMSLGGWTLDDLDRIPFTLLIPNCPVSLLTHMRSVVQTALRIAEVLDGHYNRYYQVDRDVMLSGAVLHDVGKLMEYAETEKGFVKSHVGKIMRHPFSGAALAMKHGLPDEVQHIIATHAHEGDDGYRTPASVIVHHADFINFEPLRDLLK
ncbi:HD domain-containing protein [bacterium]|nr:HD domain-containing protein [bacterium]MBU1982843.1 HD domain-containing protein [bacterium]